MSGIAVFNSAVNKLQDSQKTLQAISQARRKMEIAEEDHAFNKKKQEMLLEDAKRKGQMSDLQFDILSSQAKEYSKQQDQILKGKQTQIKLAEHQERGVAEQALNFAKIGFRADPEGVTKFLNERRFPGETMGDELEPTSSYGRPGFKRTAQAKDAKAAKPDFTQKDIMAEARARAKDDDRDIPYIDKVREHMKTAKEDFGGQIDQPDEEAPASKGAIEKFSPKTETLIEQNMKHYKRPRKDIVDALRKKNLLIMN